MFVRTYWLFIAVIVSLNTPAQPVGIVVGNNTILNGGANAYVHLPGDVRCNGLIDMATSSIWSFEGSSSQQRITCVSGSGCTNVFNTNNYLVRLGSVHQFNSNGIAVEINTMVKTVHYFYNGTTQIKEGNYWLTQTSLTPYAMNDNVSKFFITTGHGLLKQSNVGASGTFFPIGNAANTNNYTPITISYSGTADDFGIRVFDNIYFPYNTSNGDPSGSVYNYRFVKKTWIVNKTNRTTGDYFTVTPQWNLINEDANFTPRRPYDISIVRNHNSLWFPEVNQGPASPPTGAGPFTFTGNVTYDNAPWEYYPVSVSATNFVLANDAIKVAGIFQQNKVLLNWNVLSQLNISSYEVERSTDAVNFKPVAAINTINNTGNYNYTDASLPLAENIYYRIKQISNNNAVVYSNIITIKRSAENIPVLVFPNPAHNYINILFANANGDYILKLTDNAGKTISINKINVNAGETFNIPVSKFPPGIYHLKLIDQQTYWSSSYKILVKH